MQHDAAARREGTWHDWAMRRMEKGSGMQAALPATIRSENAVEQQKQNIHPGADLWHLIRSLNRERRRRRLVDSLWGKGSWNLL